VAAPAAGGIVAPSERLSGTDELPLKDTLSGVYKNGRFFSVRPVQVLSSDPPATLHGYHEHCESLSRA
jgi:hypothetical protein